jgi:hypothetical protein
MPSPATFKLGFVFRTAFLELYGGQTASGINCGIRLICNCGREAVFVFSRRPSPPVWHTSIFGDKGFRGVPYTFSIPRPCRMHTVEAGTERAGTEGPRGNERTSGRETLFEAMIRRRGKVPEKARKGPKKVEFGSF